MLPNCIINGVAKSGTTSIYHYLKSHHQIFMSERKEINYFSHGKNPSYTTRSVMTPVRTAEEYESYFIGSEGFKVRGEASPSYFSTLGTAAKIKREIPDVKFITTLRNPADRAYSGYLMNVRANNIKENAPNAFSQDKHWVKLGLYYEQLKEYYDQFSSSQIKIVLLEDLKSDKKKVLEDLFGYLEIDNNYTFDSEKIHNAGHVPKNYALHNFIRNNMFIKKTVRPMLPRKFKNFAKQFENLNHKKPATMSDEIRSQLDRYYKEDIEKVQTLIGRDLSSWQTP
jgi:hypothetical protein